MKVTSSSWLRPFVFLLAANGLAATPDRIVPTVASAPGLGGGTWRSTLTLYNGSEAASAVELAFHPAGAEGKDTDPKITLRLAAGEVRAIEDLLRDEFRLSPATGSVDVRVTEGDLPVLSARVSLALASGGSVGLSVPVVKPSDALSTGERAVLLVPGTGNLRFNVGARTLGASATALSLTLRDTRGLVRATTMKTLPPNGFLQETAAAFVGADVRAGDVIVAEVLSGSLFLYGTPVDNVTGDGSYQAAERIAGTASMSDLTSDFTPPQGREGDAREGPGVSRLVTATSPDGLAFTRTGIVVSDQADVPELVQDARGWVYLYYVGWTVGNEKNKPVVAISRDRGRTWVYKKVVLSGFEGLADPVDPDVQILPDGTFRLYVTAGQNTVARSFVAEGTDGIHFTNKGVAFTYAGGLALDPSSLKVGSVWHLFTGGIPGSNHHATSVDGRTFTYDGEVVVPKDGVGQIFANGVAVPGGYRFYTFDAMPPIGQTQGINSAFSTNGTSWTADPGRRLSLDVSTGKESSALKDPAVVRLDDGTYLMAYSTRIP